MSQKQSPQRKSPRLQGYDYSQSGAYFITICTHNRAHLFGKIVDGKMILNGMGHIARSCWMEIPTHYTNIELDLHVVMPNHVHGIILIHDDISSADGMYPVPTNDHVGTPYMCPKNQQPINHHLYLQNDLLA